MSEHAPGGPSKSVDIPGVDASATQGVDHDSARARMRLVFLAAFVFAAIAWLGTFLVAINSSETNGIRASWIAIFPTAFGAGGLLALSDPKFKASTALIGAFACGTLASFGLALFFAAIWPSL